MLQVVTKKYFRKGMPTATEDAIGGYLGENFLRMLEATLGTPDD